MAKKYGKRFKLRLSNKDLRSNRGRTRSAATNGDQNHSCMNERVSPTTRNAFIRNHKRAERHEHKRELAEELFQLELGQYDPEVWLFGTNLTTFADTCPKGTWSKYLRDPSYRGPSYFDFMDTYDGQSGWVDDYDPEEGSDYDSYEDRYHDTDSTYEDWKDYDSEPETTSERWKNLWIMGAVNDPQGRDDFDFWRRDVYDGFEEDYYFEGLEEYWREREEERLAQRVVDNVKDPSYIRDLERHKAGERYFHQNKRTVVKKLWSGTPFEKRVA